ncbi:MAG: glycosyltransferase family 4 protein, partial [Cyanobacteria bacterium J06623_7]
RGWKLILGQIDPGIIEEKLVHKIAQKYLKLQPKPDLLPLQYWSNWREECRLADRIVVNSDWSRQALAKTGIEPDKITTIPLAYKATASKFKRTYPPRFTPKRPLKVLFLGQIIIRKGIGEILEAITLLNKSINPALVEFWFVGEIKIKLSPKIKHYPQIKWLGSVSRNDTHNYYQQADILLLPTHSDGFGLTQLEAQAWKLPIIASQFCGSVVKQQINGLILPQITAREIVKSITFCLNNPQKLTDFSKNSTQTLSKFSLNKLAQKITTININ